MNEARIFRRASTDDLPAIIRIIRCAQERMRAAGSAQWQDGYPAAADIAADIARGCGYVLSEREAVAYGAVITDGEPAYDALVGEWPSDEPYVVVHRLAVAGHRLGCGLATEFLHRTEALARHAGIGTFRIDTASENTVMRHLLRREGFVACGTVRYRSGERLAYWKRL